MAIHRRKKRKVADESTSKSISNKSFAHSEQLHTRQKEWESITSRSRDADGNTRYEGNSLPHEEADKEPKPRVKKERKTWDYRYNELLDFKNKVSWYVSLFSFTKMSHLTIIQNAWMSVWTLRRTPKVLSAGKICCESARVLQSLPSRTALCTN